MPAIYLLRHGQASFGSTNYDQLSDVGHTQSVVLGEGLKQREAQADLLISGGLRRHAETAAGCLKAMGITAEPELDADFCEYDHERMLEAYDPSFANKANLAAHVLKSGDPRRGFQAVFEKAADRWASGEHDDDYDESFAEFCTRVERGVTNLAARLGRSQTALVFTSGGAISAVCRMLLGLEDQRTMRISYTIANASITKLVVGSGGVHLSTFNDHAHFEGKHRALITYR
jgi:broad specificity phosphatase PhoE